MHMMTTYMISCQQTKANRFQVKDYHPQQLMIHVEDMEI